MGGGKSRGENFMGGFELLKLNFTVKSQGGKALSRGEGHLLPLNKVVFTHLVKFSSSYTTKKWG